MTSQKTGSARSDAPQLSDTLETQLHHLKEAPFHKRGEAALRFAAMTIAAVRRLEKRIDALETKSHAEDPHAE